MGRHEKRVNGKDGAGLEVVPEGDVAGGRWFALLLIVAGLTVYANSFDGAFVFDNQLHIVESEPIRTLWPPWHLLQHRRPVVQVSLAINYAIGELEPFGYHLFNVIVHVLSGLTLYGLLRRTLALGRFSQRIRTSAPVLAFAAALLWLVHPLQTQSVTYVIQRGESLMGLCYLLTMYGLVRGACGRRVWYGVSVIACALGMGTKAVMVTTPIMVMLFDGVLLSRGWLDAWRRRWLFYLGLCATWGLLFVVGVAQGVLATDRPSGMVGFSHPTVTMWHYLFTQPGVLLRYVRLSVLPVGQSLDYGWTIVKELGPAVVPGLVVLTGLSGTVYAVFRRHPLGVVGAWFFVVLAPTSSFIPIQDPIYEHRMYLPLASMAVLVALGLFHGVTGREGRAGHARFLTIIALLAGLLGTATAMRNRVYASQLRMWNDVVTKNPRGERGRYNLGWALQQAGRMEEAFAEYAKAVELNPSFALPYNNLGMARFAGGRVNEAESLLKKAVELDPDFADAWGNLGTVLAQRGQVTEAREALQHAIDLDPTLPQAHFNLGLILAQAREFDRAEAAFRRAIACNPRLPSANYNLGHALAEQGRFAEAAVAFVRELQVNPGHPDAGQMLEAARRRAGAP